MLDLQDKTVSEEAYITRLRANGFFVLIPKYGLEGFVAVTSSADEGVTRSGVRARACTQPFTYDEAQQVLRSSLHSLRVRESIHPFTSLISLLSSTLLQVFDRVLVRISVVQQEISLTCLEPDLSADAHATTMELSYSAASTDASKNKRPAHTPATPHQAEPTAGKKQKR